MQMMKNAAHLFVGFIIIIKLIITIIQCHPRCRRRRRRRVFIVSFHNIFLSPFLKRTQFVYFTQNRLRLSNSLIKHEI